MFAILKSIRAIPVAGCIGAMLFAGLTPITARAAEASFVDKTPIPRDLRYDPIEVPAEDNAVMEWWKAYKSYAAPGESEKSAMKFAWTPGAPAPPDLSRMMSWVGRNREALDVFEGSLAKPKAQWPDLSILYAEHPEMTAMAFLTKARLLEAEQSGERQDFDKALASLEGSLRLSQAAVDADGALVHYLIAGSVRGNVEGGMVRLADRAETPLPMMDALLKDLPSLNDEARSYDHALRVDFTFYVYPSIDLQRFSELWAKNIETNATVVFPGQLRKPFRVLLDPALVALHPQPWDINAEVERSARHFRIFRKNSVSPWRSRSHEVEDETEDATAKLLADIQPLMKMLESAELPLSPESAAKARASYLKIQNPVGRIFQCAMSNFAESDERVFRNRAEREAARALIALLIYERKKGRLPLSLSELVSEGILTAPPKDCFADAPLSYSRDRRLIWSVGLDGVNDNGDGDLDHRWVGRDAIWKIPEIPEAKQ